jgi:predicted Rossmann fold flavoprotein
VADVLILGAGAAGLMCAIEAGKRGRQVLLIDHAEKVGEKIRISGGGRCNFTNLHTQPKHFISENPHFCVSALKRYTPQHFIRLMEKHGLTYHEKKLGQLFCDGRSQAIIDLLLAECREAGVEIRLNTSIRSITRTAEGFTVQTDAAPLTCQSLVVATGGKSIPKMGATGLGYQIAEQFGIPLVTPRPGLVPFTFEGAMLEYAQSLAGTAVDVRASIGKTVFEEAMLFTHRGISGPAILQISSYWQPGSAVTLNLSPNRDAFAFLIQAKAEHPRQEVATVLAELLPKRLATKMAENHGCSGRTADTPNAKLKTLSETLHAWRITPHDTEGYRTAEVTVGGVDTRALSSQSMEATAVPGLYFIGEVMDVTGHLGGFNFQWAWASGHAAGQYV